MICPCCASDVDKIDPKAVIAWPALPDRERAILQCLVSRFGQWTQTPEIADFVFADDPDGGPLGTAGVISSTIKNIRRNRDLAGWGLKLESVLGRASPGYRLTWKE